MKIIRLIPCLFVALLALFTGCEFEGDTVKPIDVGSKLAVISYISPLDTVVKVHLQKTQPAIGKELSDEQRKVINAIVTISDGSSSKTLQYIPETNDYRTLPEEWPIMAGKTYWLTISTPDGFSAKASCTVPGIADVSITDLNASYKTDPDYYGEDIRKYAVALKWRDDPNSKNYYRVMGTREYEVRDYYGNFQKQTEPLAEDYEKSYLYKDEKTDNGIITSDLLHYYQVMRSNQDMKYKLYFYLLATDKNYYLYHDALHKQEITDRNPFAEPVVLYTNIEGGVGVFAAFNQLVKVFDME